MNANSKAVLIGNGINQLNNSYSWENLMKDLVHFTKNRYNVSMGDKPFPLLHEEIFLKAKKKIGMEETEIKKEIVELLSRLNESEYHKEIASLHCNSILTTNYDYNIEEASGFSEGEKIFKRTESKYSLYRGRKHDNLNIYHIHGEQSKPNSILLGYEHYSGYLQNIRNYFFKKSGSETNPLRSLSKRLMENETEIYSWVDLFFMKNIYILGFSATFNELHLWWLFNIRARKLNGKKSHGIKNEIVYLYPEFESKDESFSFKLQLLEANEIILKGIPVGNNDYQSFYDKAFSFIKRQ